MGSGMSEKISHMFQQTFQGLKYLSLVANVNEPARLPGNGSKFENTTGISNCSLVL
jgi:hypothetical protein